MNESEHDSDIRTFQIEYSLDGDRYMRRGCASCGLHFKLVTEPSQLSTLLAPIFAETTGNSLVSSTSDVNEDTLDELTCPYCGHTDAQQDMHTDEFTEYMHRWMFRHIIEPSIRNMFDGLSNSFGRNDFIRITHESSPISVQPIAGPELPDMQVVRLLCCAETIKIISCWLDLIYCPYCARKNVLL